MPATTIESKLRRGLKRRAAKGPVTVDDARELLTRMGEKPTFTNIRRVLRRPLFRPSGWMITDKPSRHGRPIRRWALAD